MDTSDMLSRLDAVLHSIAVDEALREALGALAEGKDGDAVRMGTMMALIASFMRLAKQGQHYALGTSLLERSLANMRAAAKAEPKAPPENPQTLREVRIVSEAKTPDEAMEILRKMTPPGTTVGRVRSVSIMALKMADELDNEGTPYEVPPDYVIEATGQALARFVRKGGPRNIESVIVRVYPSGLLQFGMMNERTCMDVIELQPSEYEAAAPPNTSLH